MFLPLAVSVQLISVYPQLISQSQLRQVVWIALVDWLHRLADHLYIMTKTPTQIYLHVDIQLLLLSANLHLIQITI